MAKCLVDIKKDIIDDVTKKLSKQGATIQDDTGYFANPNKASKAIASVNNEYKELVVKESEKGSFTIDPSDRLAQKYLDKYTEVVPEEPKQITLPLSKAQLAEMKRGGYTEEQRGEFFQQEGTEGSTASPKTITAIKNFLKQIGVDIKAGKEIVVNGKRMDANAVAMVTQKLIQVVEGAEAKALPEEAMHFAVEIIKQTNPKLYNQLLKEVGSYALTNQVFADYGKNPLYQTKDGKPDVVKLKEEAMGKILAETVIRNNEGLTEKPELLAKAESWWQSILNWFKNLIAKSGFDRLSMDILSGKFEGTAEDIKAAEDKAFLQQAQNPQDRVIAKIKEINSKIEKRADGYYIDGKKINKRVTQVVDDNWYSRKFKNNDLTKSEYAKAVDEQKAEKGTKGHADLEHALSIFLNADGTLKNSDELDQAILDDSGYVSQINPNDSSMYVLLRSNLRERLEAMEAKNPGTKFLSEVTVFNPNAYGGLAGTIDFLAIAPNGKVSILDWKFMAIADKYTDVPWYKVGAWQEQMRNYKLILQNVYGVKSENFEQTRMIPIQAIYSEGNAKANILPQLLNIRIGDANVKNIKDDYLLPVALQEESTGNKKIDKLLEKLNAEYKRLSEKSVTPAEKAEKAEALNALYTAIRHLQIKQNLQPIVRQAKLLNKQIQKTITKYKDVFEGKDPKDFSEKERNAFTKEIEVAQDMVNVYTKIDTELASFFAGELTEEDEKLRNDLRDTASNARELESALEDILNEYSENILAKSEGIEKYLTPEKVIKGGKKFFSSTATLQSKAIQFIYKKANRALAYTGMDVLTENKKLLKIKEAYDAWAKRKGLSNANYFDLIKKKDKNELIDEFNPEFYTTLKSKIADKDFDWIRNNIDVAAYNAKLKEILNEELERIDNKARIGTDEEIAAEIKKEKFNANKLYNTSTTESPGWLLYDDIKNFPKRDVWESKEWKELNKSENAPAKEFYKYIINRNNELKEIGYIGRGEARVFLPFVRKGLMEKIIFGGKVTVGEQFLRSISVDEGDIGYGKIDPLKGTPVNTIPKYFASEIEGDISTDLFKTIGLLNEMSIKYKYLSEVEDQIKGIIRVEKNKQAIRTSLFGKTQYNKNTGELEYTPDNSDNAKLAEDMMKAIIYNQRYIESETFDQVLGKLGNWGSKLNEKLGVKIFPENLSGRQISVNKIIDSINTQFQLSTLGFNMLSATSNFFGGNAQSIINAGKYFTKTDYIASEGELVMNKLTNNENRKKILAAIEYFVPYTDNETSRELLKKLSLSKLSQENFQDALMYLMRKSDLNVQTVNFMSFLKNSIVENGEVLNAREYVRSQPKYENRYEGTTEQRKALEEEFEKDVKELIEQKGVLKLSQLVDGELVIPGVERKSDSVVKLRRQVQQLSKDALGNLSEDDLRMINMTVYGKSFMIFKNWIPRLVDVRMGNLKYNAASDAYEWGRMRTVFRLLTTDLFDSLSSLTNSIAGNDQKWVDQMKNLYETKREEYKRDTGKDLNMTQEQFMDLVSQNVRNQMFDTMFLLALFSLVAALKAFAPDDDEDPAVRNQYKFMVKAADKLRDEISYFYDPTSFSSLFSSGIFPSLGLIDNFKKGLKNFAKENYAIAIGDEKMEEDNKVIKYWMRTFPVTNQIVGYLPMMYPELAKDLGIKMQSNYGIR